MKLLQMRKKLQGGKSIFDLPLRVAFYARVSTEKSEQLNSLDNQISHYNEYIDSIPNWTLAGAYIDEGLSGTSVSKRDSFIRMIQDAKHDRFDLLITKEISRFSRNTLDSIRYTQELLQYGVGVYFQSDNINTLDPDSELRLTIMSSIAQDEVRKLSERLKFGYRRAVANGRVLGQDNLWGYDKKDGQLTINESEAKIVRMVFDQYTEGKCGLRRIARELEKEGILDSKGKMFSYATLHGMLRNPKYKGWYVGHKSENTDYRLSKTVALGQEEWVMYPSPTIPAIVPEDLWEKANWLLDERGKRMKECGQACQARYPYSGKIFCSEHGTSYHRHVFKSKKGEKECWNCKLYRLKGKADGCDSPTIYTSELNEIMTQLYISVVENKSTIVSQLVDVYRDSDCTKDNGEKMEKLNVRASTLEQKKEKLLELFIEGLIDKEEFAKRNNQYNDELNVIARDIDGLLIEQKATKSLDASIKQWRSDLESILSTDKPFCEDILSIILDHIIVHKTGDKNHIKLDIYLKFGTPFAVGYDRGSSSILLSEIGISQAQVSRLEKNAISQIKKYL